MSSVHAPYTGKNCAMSMPSPLHTHSAVDHMRLTPWHTPVVDNHDPQIHNIVSTSTTMDLVQSTTPIHLQTIAQSLPCCKYDRSKFAAMTIRICNPCCTALLFTTGKLVVTGASNWYESMLSAMQIAVLISSIFTDRQFVAEGCEMQNIVAHTCIQLQHGFTIDLQKMYNTMSLECTYQPTMFPGLSYRPIGSPVVILCFRSGKVVVTGGKKTQDVKTGWDAVKDKLSQFQKAPSAPAGH